MITEKELMDWPLPNHETNPNANLFPRRSLISFTGVVLNMKLKITRLMKPKNVTTYL